ncbi:MAG: hypothetical protein AABX03_01505 [Nanoarchaeota archaeon]
MRGKRGISEVITTILIILLSVAAISILAVFLVPFVRNNLEKSGSCVGVLDKIDLVQDSSCYSAKNTTIRVRFKDINVSELYLVLSNETASKNYKLKSGESYNYLLAGNPVKMPDPNGGERTYLFNWSYNKASIGAVTKTGACDMSDEIVLEKC